MNWLYLLGLGVIAGVLGKIIMPGKDPGGIIITIILGIGGAYLGGWVAGKLGHGGLTGEFDLYSILIATGGAIGILLIYRVILRKG